MKRRRGPRFVVEVVPGGAEAAHGRQRIAVTNEQRTAISKLCEIMQQWALSEGAVTPGTMVSIVDTEVVQEILRVTYAGYASATLMGGSKTWQELAAPPTPPTSPR